MKKNRSIVAIIMLLAGLGFWVTANAGTLPERTYPAGGHHWQHEKNGAGLLDSYIRHNMAVQVLSDLTKVPVDSMRQKLQEERLPAVLQEYHIDRATFANAIQTKMKDFMGTLVAGNYLSAEQRSQILTRMDQHAQRRELLKSVIDKAVADGTITSGQAQMLLRRP